MTADLLFRAFLKVYLFKEMLFSDRKAFLNYVLSNSLASQQFLALPSFAKMTVSPNQNNYISISFLYSMSSEIETLKERNKRVEADKAWETSKTRRLIIALMTYFVVVFFLWSIAAPKPWLNALVPTVGFLLSTLTLPFFKKLWLKYH